MLPLLLLINLVHDALVLTDLQVLSLQSHLELFALNFKVLLHELTDCILSLLYSLRLRHLVQSFELGSLFFEFFFAQLLHFFHSSVEVLPKFDLQVVRLYSCLLQALPIALNFLVTLPDNIVEVIDVL